MELSHKIAAYYWTHFDELSFEKQFHFANRLASWSGDSRAQSALQQLKPKFIPGPETGTLENLLQRSLSEQPPHTMTAYELRAPYFLRYPQLYGWHQGLFRVRHLEELFQIPATKIFSTLVSAKEQRNVASALLEDPEALRTLSTLAINFIYLHQRYVEQTPHNIPVATLLSTVEEYNLADTEQLRLMLYLVTHCIIAGSNFYGTHVPTEHAGLYLQALTKLEHTIASRLSQLSLDTKLEFLVCCRILGYDSQLSTPIYEECVQSVSPEGTFLVDTHNEFAKHMLKRTFGESEHRNVLFIMSSSDYLPKS